MNKLAIITGAAGHIGAATAHILSQQGYHLLLVDQTKERLAQLASQIPHSTICCMDVTHPDAVARLFDQASQNLTHVILAAGIEGPVNWLEHCSDESFHTVMRANVTSVWLGIKHALRIFKPKKSGNIIVLSSISGVTATPFLSPYCASKHAVTGLVKTAAREAASMGIRINAVCPGPVNSAMMERIDTAFTELDQRKEATRSIPMQRYATPEEVAQMIVFLCSEASQYCTGTAMTVDGGLTCR